jgi:hypothetical protein
MKEAKEVYSGNEDMLLWRKFEDKLAALYIHKSADFFTYTTAKKQSLPAHYMQWTSRTRDYGL